jgi:hypothetical protein
MRNQLLVSVLLVAVSQSDARPAPKASDGLTLMKAIAAKKTKEIRIELNRKFVSTTIDPASGKRASKAFCGDDDMTLFNALPKKIADRYGARVAAALGNPDQGIRCETKKDQILCEVSAQDEHEKALTFLIVKESYGPVLAGYVERETWMVDPDSARYRTDVRERDALLAKATTDDCFKPESSRARDQSH